MSIQPEEPWATAPARRAAGSMPKREKFLDQVELRTLLVFMFMAFAAGMFGGAVTITLFHLV